jgi:hypothetical protein
MPELPHVFLSTEDIAPVMQAIEALGTVADRLHTAATSDGAGVSAEITLTVPNVAQFTLKR